MLTASLLKPIAHGFSDRVGVPVGTAPVLARQVHSAVALEVVGPWRGPPPQADALVSRAPGLWVGVVTADCAPVLLADRDAGVVAAAHAGWRGAAGGVIASTVGAMEALGADRARIVAAIGPTIAQRSYEVDAAMRDCFAPADHGFFIASAEGRWQFDLPGFVAAALRAEGIAKVEDLAEDTYAQPARFFSYRRATHRGEPTGGRQISCIAAP